MLGEDARYRNARLSYFTGDFEWAQQQFDILKSATTRLIANDAIDMSVFIMDNLNLDTTDVTLAMFATAELLVFQNKFDEAFIKLDSVATKFPEHSLIDDIYYTKAQIYKKLQQPDKAIEMYNLIIENTKTRYGLTTPFMKWHVCTIINSTILPKHRNFILNYLPNIQAVRL